MRTTGIMLLITMLISCIDKAPAVNYCKLSGFVLADTGYAAKEYLKTGDEMDFPIYYMGSLKDTIGTGVRWWRRKREYLQDGSLYIFKHLQSNLLIEVDTLHSLTRSLDYLNTDGTFNSDSAHYFHASAVIFRNISDTAIYMGLTCSVFYMHREMLNKKGEWVKIGNKLSEDLFCATGQPDIILKPGEVMISKVSHYGGEHPVACRLAFGRRDHPQVYSNVFTECVDDSLLNIIEAK